MLSEAMEKLCASLSCVGYRGDRDPHILIKETDVLAKLKKVTLQAPTGDWFSFVPDSGRGEKAQMSALLAHGKQYDHHRACDSVVFVCRNEKLSVLYIDLKSENPKGYAGQFKSTRQFVRYLLGLLHEFHDRQIEIAEERYVILFGGQQVSINKTRTTPNQVSLRASKPDNAYKREVVNDAKLHLREFLL